MPNNIFNQNKPVRHNGRNGFDGSYSEVLTMRPSVLQPVFIEDTVPNSSYRINAADVVRTSALQTAAFIRGKQELDFYFVPYSMLYSAANNVILQRGDQLSPINTVSLVSFPKFPLAALVYNAALPYLIMRFINKVNSFYPSFGGSFVQFVEQMLSDMFGTTSQGLIPWFKFSCTYDFGSVDSNDLVYQDIHWVGSDCLHLLAYLGYGDYYLQIKSVADSLVTTISDQSSLEQACLNMTSALSMFITYNVDESFDDQQMSGDRLVSLVRLAAYHKVFYDHYRDSINDDNNLYVFASSLDVVPQPIDVSHLVVSLDLIYSYNNILATYLRPHRRMYYKDLSCGIYNSTQFGSMMNFVDSGNTMDSLGVAYRGSNTLTAQNVGARLSSAYAIKFTMAMQKYKEMLMRAGSRTKDILMAEFGVKSRYVDDHYSRYLGSFDGSLDLNKVSATADTGDYNVGDLAANCFSSLQGSTIEETVNDYGIIIGVFSFIANPLHNAFGIDKFNYKFENLDFYHDDFANLGLQPVDSSIFSLISAENGVPTLRISTLGFAARDFEYKQKLDFAFSNFCTAPLINASFISAWQSAFANIPYLGVKNGSNSNYVLVKPTKQTISQITERVYQLPDSFDTVFKTYDSGDPDYHHFECALTFNVSKILPMPVMGML